MAEPNDAPFQGPATPPPATPPPTQGASAPPPAQPDPGQAARVLQDAIRGAIQPLAQRMEALEVRMSESARAAAPPPAPVGDNDWVDIITDKDKFRQEMIGLMRETIGPAIAPIVETTRHSIESEQRSRIESYYGEGTWDEVVAERYNNIMSRLQKENPTATFSRSHISTIVDSIVGSQEAQENLSQRRAKQEQVLAQQRRQAPRFAGPGSPRLSSGDEITDEDRDIIARIQKSLGKDAYSEEKFMEARKARAGGA